MLSAVLGKKFEIPQETCHVCIYNEVQVEAQLPLELDIGKERLESRGGDVGLAVRSFPHDAVNILLYFAYLNASPDVQVTIENHANRIDQWE